MPQFGQRVREAALKETDWNPEKAALMLRRFHVANTSKLSHLHKKRKRILNALARFADRDWDRWGGLSDASDDASHSTSSSERRSKRALKKRKLKRLKKKLKSSKKQRTSFGKYGIIKESDFLSKRAEFVKWATNVKNIDTETLTRVEELKLFSVFAEDFNTGTLPHVKYYDLEDYHRRKKEKKIAKKKLLDKEYRFDDEEDKRKEKERKRTEDHNRRIQEAYYELKTSEKASDMKQQELLRAQLKLAYKTGDTVTAGKLAGRLRPDDPNDPLRMDLPEEW